MKQKKVNILPCSGIGKVLGTLSRWSAFELVDNERPDDTNLLCLARLVAGDEHSSDVIKNNYNITLDGCPKKCAYKNVDHNGGMIQHSILMAKYLVKNKDLEIDTKNVSDPGPGGLELAKRIAKELAVQVDRLTSTSQEE